MKTNNDFLTNCINNIIHWMHIHNYSVINTSWLIIGITFGICISFFIYNIIIMLKNEKKAKIFRSNLKIDDKVHISGFKDGIVYKINNDDSFDIIVKVYKKFIYPKNEK